MKLYTLFVCGWLLMPLSTSLCFAQVYSPTRQSATAKVGPKIKVLLEKDTPSAFLEARGPYRVIRKDSGSLLSSGKGNKRFVVHALQDGLRWGEEYPDVYQISILPTNRNSSIFVNGIQYKGSISIYHVRNNYITIVNEVPIEDYLKSSLAIQFEEEMSKEALAALTIAARTEAYKKVLQGISSSRPWDVSAGDASYYGFGVTQRKNGVDEAVDWTRYMVLESIKQSAPPLQNVQLSATKADELAKKGWDAQKILRSAFPHSRIGSTINPNEVAIR